MATSTTNLSLTKPANGEDADTWDVPVNGNSDILDTVVGGTTTFNVVGASGTVAITTAQYRPRVWTASGALTANVDLQLPSGIGGTWSVGNSTSGSFTVTISSAGAGTSYIVPQGTRVLLVCDGINVFAAFTQTIVPLGLIAIWSGSIATIPANWHLCDGTNGTVDLRDRFIVGAGNAYAVGATGGATSNTPTITVSGHALTQAELPAYGLAVSDPGHAHGTTDPGHQHYAYQYAATAAPGAETFASLVTNGVGGSYNGYTAIVNTGVTINTAFTSISVSSGGSNSPHTHPASSTAVPTLPPYYALAFIQKIT